MKSFSNPVFLSGFLFAFLLGTSEAASQSSEVSKEVQNGAEKSGTSSIKINSFEYFAANLVLQMQEADAMVQEHVKEDPLVHEGKYFIPRIYPKFRKGSVNEDQFFDPASDDMKAYLSDWAANLRSGFVLPLQYRTPFDLKYSNYAYKSYDPALIDICMSIDSRFSSKSATIRELKSDIEDFWRKLGLFDYHYTDGEHIIPVSFEDIIQAISRYTSNDADPDNLKLSPSKASIQTKASKSTVNASKIYPLLMKADRSNVRKTLETVSCRRALIHSMKLMSKSQHENMLRFSPATILNDPEIFDSIPDYSGFKDDFSIEKLVAIFLVTFSGIPLLINEAMARTLPSKALHQIIALKNFDLSKRELDLLNQHRNGFHLKKPFNSDHRTFRIFAAYHHSSMSLPVDLITNESTLIMSMIESILAEYLRSEFEIRNTMKQLSRMFYEDYMISEDESSKFKDTSFPLIKKLIEIFDSRLKVIKFIDGFEGYSRISSMLRTPMNGFFRKHLQEISGDRITKINQIISKHLFLSEYDEEEIMLFLLELFYLYEPESSVIYSEAFSKLMNRLRDVKVYEIPTPESDKFSIQSIASEWLFLVEDFTNFKFYKGRWMLNFISSLSKWVHSSESAVLEENIRHRYAFILKYIPLDYSISIPLFGEIRKYDWISSLFDLTYALSPESHDNERELRHVWERLDFGDEEVIEKIWTDKNLMYSLVCYPGSLSDQNISRILSTQLGRNMLKHNPELLLRLPSFASFSLENMKELGLRLDDLAPQIRTLDYTVAQAWLKDQEYLVNSAAKAVLLQSPKVFAKDLNIWQFITVETVKARSEVLSTIRAQNKDRSPWAMQDLLNAKGTSLPEKLSLIARFYVHYETQMAMLFFLCKFLNYNVYENIADFYRSMELNIQSMINILTKERTRASPEEIEDINKLLLIVNGNSISTYKDLVVSRPSKMPYNVGVDEAYAEDLERNEFIRSLIEKGPGSSKFKRVWCHRARILVLTDANLRIKGDPADLVEAANSGSIPLCDALLQWIILNNSFLKRFQILANLNRISDFDKTNHPQTEWIKTFFHF